MISKILQAGTRFMMPLLLLFSVFLFVRGHNYPGGGFIAGLVATAAFALYLLAYDVQAARNAVGTDPRKLITVGLFLLLLVALAPLLRGLPMLAQRYFWIEPVVPGFGKVPLGVPLLFDLGVYLAVLGVTLTIILTLAEEEE